MAGLKSAEVRRFGKRLRARRDALREILRAELVATRREEYQELAGQVHDVGDESVAELLIGVDLSGRERELHEMQDVESALERIKQGSFGVCIDCRTAIEIERLDAYATAKRCYVCQQRYEQNRNGGKNKKPSL